MEHPDAARAHPDLGIDGRPSSSTSPAAIAARKAASSNTTVGSSDAPLQREPDLAQGALHDAPVAAGRQGGIDERTDIGAPRERAVVHGHIAGDRLDDDPALAVPV